MALGFFLACAHAPKPQRGPKTALLFVPGFKGSVLKTQSTGETVWLPGLAAFGGDRSLRMEGEALAAGGVLRRIDLIPHVLGVDAYGAWLHTLEKHFEGRAALVPFSYDWRQDNAVSARQLAVKVEALQAQGFEKIWLIAHSMGGLVAGYYLRYGDQDPATAVENWQGAQRVERVVFAGTPFGGTVEMFVDMQIGITTLRNKKLLDAPALNSFPACYQLLPFPGENQIFLGEGPGESAGVFDAELWRQQGWGVFKAPCVDAADCQHRLQHLQAHLGKGQRFLALLNAPPLHSPPSHLRIFNIVGEGRGTPERVFWQTGRHFFFRQSQLPKHAPWLGRSINDPGDGLIALRAARLPEAFSKDVQSAEVRVSQGHGGLFQGRALQDRLFQFFE